MSDIYRLDAIDFCIFEGPDGVVEGLVTTRTPATKAGPAKRILEQLLSELHIAPPDDFFASYATYLHPDFFLWLLYRTNSNKWISDSLFLNGVPEIAGADLQRRRSSLGDNATLDRAELLALLMNDKTTVGPAKVWIEDVKLDFECQVKLFPDGGFELNVGSSRYGSGREIGITMGTDFRVTMFEDAAFGTLPRLVSAYHDDKSWRDSGRENFLIMARDALQVVLEELINA